MNTTIDSIMVEKEKKYEHLKKYEKKSREADNITTHIDLTHMEVYAKAAKDVLKVEKDNVEDIRQKDLEKLKEDKFQIKLADKMADLYRDSAKEYFSRAKEKAGEKWDVDEFDEALLIRSLYGTTRQELKQIIANEKDQFSPEKFMAAYRKKFMETISRDLKDAAGQHLKSEHIEDIIKYTGIDKHDVDPSRMVLPEAINYLESYINLGSIPPKQIQKKHKKPKKKED